MRVLITGGTGFVGANLARRLLRDGHEIHLIVRSQTAFWRLNDVRSALHIHVANLQDREAVIAAVAASRPEWVFHLAVHGAYSDQINREEIYRSNVLGTANLLEACERADFAVFVNTGSSSEYGFVSHAPGEDELPRPNSDYAVSKVAATMLCGYTARRLSRPVPTLRLYSVYGPYEEPRRLVPRLLRLGMEGQWPPLVSPRIARDFIYIDDVVDAYLKVVQASSAAPDAIYNIGSGRQITLGEIVETVRALCAIEAEPVWNNMEQRIWDTDVWVGNVEKAARELNWTPQTSLRDGLSATLSWMRDHQSDYPLEGV
jgi:nucleoside-diphosphate-sugar epimerase